MKKAKFAATAAFLALSLVVFMPGCASAEELSAPVQIDIDENNRLNWNSVDNAKRYVINIVNVDSGTANEENTRRLYYSLDALPEGDYEIKLKCQGDGKLYTDSDWSEVVYFHRDFETGCIYKLINNNTEYEISKVGTAIGNISLDGVYRNKPVTRIGDGAFRSSNKVTGVTVGESVTAIGANAFYNCPELTSVSLPTTLTAIGNSAFQSCRKLATVNIPAGVEKINPYTFANCHSISSVEIPETVKTIGEAAFMDCSAIGEITLPDSVTELGEYAFSANKSATKLTVGAGLEKIGKYAFYRGGMTEIEYSAQSSLKTIGQYAFAECDKLTAINLPEGLTDVGDGAFNKCTEAATVSIPSSVTHVGGYAFDQTKACSDEQNIIDGIIYADEWVVGCVKEKKDEIRRINTDATDTNSTTIKQGTVGIADAVFASCEKLETVTLGNGLKYVGQYAFFNNPIYILEIKSSVRQIDACAFANCTSLVSVTINSGLQTIGDRAFYQCSVLSANDEFIPATVTSIGMEAFVKTNCTPDENGVVYAGNWVVDIDDANYVTTMALKSGTRGIANYSFYNAANLQSISGMTAVRYVGEGAFYGCSSLASISLGTYVNEIKPHTFYKCSSLLRVNFGSQLKSIGRSAFYGAKLSEVDLSLSQVTEIGNRAFYGNENLTNLVLNAELKKIDDYAFFKNKSLTSVTFGENVESIGAHTFSKCEDLESVTFNGKIKEIGDYCFYGAKNLRGVTLPDNIERVGRYAFYESGLRRIDLGKVKIIGDYAFAESKLKGAVIPATVESVGKFAFKNCVRLEAVQLSGEVGFIDKHVFYGCSMLTVFTDATEAGEKWNVKYNSSFKATVYGCTLDETEAYVESITIGEGTFANEKDNNGLLKLSAPCRNGYEFLGWTTDKSVTDKENLTADDAEFSANELSKLPVGTTVYSLWRESSDEEFEFGFN